jgi:hypothetical protein
MKIVLEGFKNQRQYCFEWALMPDGLYNFKLSFYKENPQVFFLEQGRLKFKTILHVQEVLM